MSDICKQDTEKVLLVEGDNDCHVVMALCAAHHVPETFGIYQCGSDVGVLKRLNALISRPNPPQAIGVMLDADRSLAARWDSVRGKLRHYNYPFPVAPSVNGTIVNDISDPLLERPRYLDAGHNRRFGVDCANRHALVDNDFALHQRPTVIQLLDR